MSRFCLDTCFYGELRRGHREASKVLARAREILVPVTVLGELRAGFKGGSRAEQNEATLRQFLSEPVVRVVETNEDVADRYADLMAAVIEDRLEVPTNDVWIAAAALSEGAPVLTFDQHFNLISGVGVVLLKL